MIARYRHQMEQLRDEEVHKAIHQLQHGHSPEQVITELGRILTNKITHHPSMKMRRAGFEGRQDALSLASEILGLDNDIG
jgi:glutamyl-tRNA reductase